MSDLTQGLSNLSNQVSDIFRLQIRNYIGMIITFGDLPNQDSLPQKQEETILQNKKIVESFLNKWVPELYGIQQYHSLYRHACLTELVRWCLAFNLTFSKNFTCHWYWEKEKVGTIPERLVIIAILADHCYTFMKALRILPKGYSVTRFNTASKSEKVNGTYN